VQTVKSLKKRRKYTYDTDSKVLTIKYNNNPDQPYKVEILSSSELKILDLSTDIDYNGDGVNDRVYITFKR
jgi:membrane-bound inhibitor of C-type lysozyme